MPTATLTTKGQVTIPANVRQRLGLTSGDRIEFVEIEGGFAIKPAIDDVRSLFDQLPRVIEGAGRVEELASIGKRVWSHVDHSHDHGWPGKGELEVAGAKDHFPIIVRAASTNRLAIAPTSSSGTPIFGLADWLSMWHWSLT